MMTILSVNLRYSIQYEESKNVYCRSYRKYAEVKDKLNLNKVVLKDNKIGKWYS